jgi:flavin reductase (DIM6/NTAB) family NADH-FMN oxidoreductase RutF
MTIHPGDIKTAQLHAYLLGSVSPRPICFASTIDADGNPNLSPFSFFNIFGSNPVTLIFSPARRVRDNTIKHTLENCIATKEVVINIVNYAIVQQMSLSSCEYPVSVNEFTKSGLTPIASTKVKPFRVKESPVQLECIVKQVIETGSEGGAGNLIICEMVAMHINDDILDADQQIDPHKIDVVGRMGKDWYVRASGDAIFEVEKPNFKLGMGIDNLPNSIKNSEVLTGNHLGMLGNVSEIPARNVAFKNESLQILFNEKADIKMRHALAASLLNKGNVADAWQVLLA